jgi:hypothetical protein
VRAQERGTTTSRFSLRNLAQEATKSRVDCSRLDFGTGGGVGSKIGYAKISLDCFFILFVDGGGQWRRKKDRRRLGGGGHFPKRPFFSKNIKTLMCRDFFKFLPTSGHLPPCLRIWGVAIRKS